MLSGSNLHSPAYLNGAKRKLTRAQRASDELQHSLERRHPRPNTKACEHNQQIMINGNQYNVADHLTAAYFST